MLYERVEGKREGNQKQSDIHSTSSTLIDNVWPNTPDSSPASNPASTSPLALTSSRLALLLAQESTMVRKLPWLTNTTTTQPARTPHQNPSKRQKLLPPSSNLDSNLTSRSPSDTKNAPTSRIATQPARTPSTFPPPQPPSEEEMRPGLDADDIYIMVEDEFLAVAQQFTKHLHHAEYQRLKALAKTQNQNAISRPVDGKTALRPETKKKLESSARQEKLKEGIAQIPGLKKPGEQKADESDSTIEDEGPESWQGTQLQRFMTKSPRKPLSSLTGLQGVASSTRAAAGYPKPERGSSPLGPAISPLRTKKLPRQGFEEDNAEDEEEEDDDDLDAPVRSSSRAPQIPAKKSTAPAPSKTSSHYPSNNKKPNRAPALPQKRAFLDLTPLPAPTTSQTLTIPPRHQVQQPRTRPGITHTPPKQPSPIKEEDLSSPEGAIRRKLAAGREEREKARLKSKRGDRTERERESGRGVDAIPMFLV